MKPAFSRAAIGTTFALVMGTTALTAQAQEQWARVISATPIPETTGLTRYNVSYEYQGQQYSTVMDSRPGASIRVQANTYGVTTAPVAPQARLAPARPPETPAVAPWEQVIPEPGVVLSSGAPVAPVYTTAPVYRQAVPIYAPAPVYVQPAYAVPQPYLYPPVGISLNLGYSRGWGGGYGGYRGYGGYGGYGGHRGHGGYGGYGGWRR